MVIPSSSFWHHRKRMTRANKLKQGFAITTTGVMEEKLTCDTLKYTVQEGYWPSKLRTNKQQQEQARQSNQKQNSQH